LYIHFPFCMRKCLYCDFNSIAGSAIPPSAYCAAVLKEMEIRRSALPAEVTASTLYLGGGTPSLMEPRLVGLLINDARRLFALAPDAEITMEANPGTVNRERLVEYRVAGVNRLSLGIQSFSEGMLVRLGRAHTAREGLASFKAARDAGFDNVGIDLIHSLPEQTAEMWQEELARAVSLRPEHISAYGLTIEAGTPFHDLERSGELNPPEEETAAEMFEKTSLLLCKTGYEQYEISNFALPGFRSRHNQVYWQRGDYLGFGAGAHSFLSTPPLARRWKNQDEPESYIQSLANSIIPEEGISFITERDAMSEWLFLGLRMLDGVDSEAFRRDFGLPLHEAYAKELQLLLSEALLEWRGPLLRLTRRGLILSNQVFMRLI